jgi:hypothetical protein
MLQLLSVISTIVVLYVSELEGMGEASGRVSCSVMVLSWV